MRKSCSPGKKRRRSFKSKLRKLKNTDGTVLDYGRWRNATMSLILSGQNLSMNDNDLRNAIKRALFFAQSSIRLFQRRKKQIDIMEECLDLEMKQCHKLMGECKEVLKTRLGTTYQELEKSLLLRPPPPNLPPRPPILPFSIYSTPPPNLSTPPPPIYFRRRPPPPLHFLRPPPQAPENLMSVPPPSVAGNYSCRDNNRRRRFDQDDRSRNSWRTPPRRNSFDKRNLDDCGRNRSIPPPGLVGVNITGVKCGNEGGVSRSGSEHDNTVRI